MSIVILGGNECMERRYMDLCQSYRCRAKVFIKPVGGLKKKLGDPDLTIFFTSTMSHKMVQSALRELKSCDTVIERCHTSSPVRSTEHSGKARRIRRAYIMSEELVVRQCAPTLAGIKTGSLFSCPCNSPEELRQEVRRINRLLAGKGLCLLPLRFDGSRALLYLYRPSRLRQDLEDAEAVRLLEESGYPCHSAGQCVACLIRRLRESEEFPHEIGLFLSYPPEDVRGFIENKACRFKCAGLWKVYGDEERAKELFRQYKRCTDRCCALWRAGSGLAQLAV